MNPTSPDLQHASFASNVADQLRSQGFKVFVEPPPELIPFELPSYRADLLASRGSENLIIEIKPSNTKFSADQYNMVAEAVSRHSGWRFLLVTGDDSVGIADRLALPSMTDLQTRKNEAEQLLANGMSEAAFVLLWSYIEAALRIRVRKLGLVIDGFAISRLIKTLYSAGELSLPHFEQLSRLLHVRNQIVHGFKAPDVTNAARALSNIVTEIEKDSLPAV